VRVCVCVCVCVCISKYCVKVIATRYRLAQQHMFNRKCMDVCVYVLRRRAIS